MAESDALAETTILRSVAAGVVVLRPPPEDVVAAVDALLAAERPIILAGGGVIASQASDEVRQLAETLGLGVATTYMGKGTLPENHPLALGPFDAVDRA